MQPVNIDAEGVKEGVLGLVLALVEIIKEALEIQAFKRMESGTLQNDEMERLGAALAELDEALTEIKAEQGAEQTVKAIRDGLDDVVDEVIDRLLNPERWLERGDNNTLSSSRPEI